MSLIRPLYSCHLLLPSCIQSSVVSQNHYPCATFAPGVQGYETVPCQGTALTMHSILVCMLGAKAAMLHTKIGIEYSPHGSLLSCHSVHTSSGHLIPPCLSKLPTSAATAQACVHLQDSTAVKVCTPSAVELAPNRSSQAVATAVQSFRSARRFKNSSACYLTSCQGRRLG
jgi:hypothetical protein